MLVSITLVLVGFALLIWNAERFVMGAGRQGTGKISRLAGVTLLLVFLGYQSRVYYGSI